MSVIALVWALAVWQTTWQLPVTILVKQDVPVENSQPLGYQQVGREDRHRAGGWLSYSRGEA